MKTKLVNCFAWLLSLAVSVLAVVAWQEIFYTRFENLNAYSVFPLFGLLAFGLMWTHYIMGAVRRLAGVEKQSMRTYFGITGWLAFVFIIVHPSLLIAQLWADGAGLPPNSYLEYVGPSLKWAMAFGTFAFIMFVAFETKRWFDERGWWPIVEYGNVIAMFAIIAHALALGSNLQQGWYRTVWFWYAITLLASILYIYYQEARAANKEGKLMKKVIGIVIVLLVLVGGGVFAYNQLNKDEGQPAPLVVDDSVSSQEVAVDSTTAVFTVAEVQTHNSETDCWTIISGSVYDITSYVPRHPGGEEILRACGEDGTTLFTERTDESGNEIGSGTGHSSSAASQLDSFKIGTVSQ